MPHEVWNVNAARKLCSEVHPQLHAPQRDSLTRGQMVFNGVRSELVVSRQGRSQKVMAKTLPEPHERSARLKESQERLGSESAIATRAAADQSISRHCHAELRQTSQ